MSGRRLALALVVVLGATLVVLAPWSRARAARAAAPSAESPTSVPEGRALELAEAPGEREPLPEPGAPSSPEATPVAATATAHAFLPAGLAILETRVPQKLAEFDAASATERLKLARELLAHSIAITMCATGMGPIPKGAPGDGDASYAGQEGKWSFQLNDCTFHFQDYEFPEYPEYMALLRTAYDADMIPLPDPIELPEDLARRIRQRALQAIAWL